jgi:hypothetical protein
MKRSRIPAEAGELVPGRAEGYSLGPDGTLRAVVRSVGPGGDGGLFSTVEDLGRWLAALERGSLPGGGPDLVETLTTPGRLADGSAVEMAFGLIDGSYRGLPTLFHGGGSPGYRASVVRFPEQSLGVVVLCNRLLIEAGMLSRRVAEVYLGAAGVEFPEPPIAPGVPDGEDPDARTGLYWNPTWGLLTVERTGDQLAVGSFGVEFRVAPVAPGDYRGVGSSSGVTVRFGEDGETETATVTVSESRRVESVRRKAPPPEGEERDSLARWVGRYRSAELDGTEYEIALAERGLVLRWPLGPPVPLEPLGESRLGGGFVALEPLLPEAGSEIRSGARSGDGRDRSQEGFLLDAGTRVRGLRFIRVRSDVEAD